MIHERGKNAFIQGQTGTGVPEWNSGGNAMCCWYIEVFRIMLVEASINQARDLVSSLDANVTQGGHVIENWELRPKGRTVLSALIQCFSRDRTGLGGSVQGAKFSRKLCPLELKWR